MISHHAKNQLDSSKRSRVIPSWKIWRRRRRHPPGLNYSPPRNVFRRGQKWSANLNRLLCKIIESTYKMPPTGHRPLWNRCPKMVTMVIAVTYTFGAILEAHYASIQPWQAPYIFSDLLLYHSALIDAPYYSILIRVIRPWQRSRNQILLHRQPQITLSSLHLTSSPCPFQRYDDA